MIRLKSGKEEMEELSDIECDLNHLRTKYCIIKELGYLRTRQNQILSLRPKTRYCKLFTKEE
jgi:hypothetical protein